MSIKEFNEKFEVQSTLVVLNQYDVKLEKLEELSTADLELDFIGAADKPNEIFHYDIFDKEKKDYVETDLNFNELKVFIKNLKEFEKGYSFYDGLIGEYEYFDTFNALIENCKKDIFTWVEERQNNLELDCQLSVQGMVDTLSEYAKFLGDIKHVDDKQRVARAIEGMYRWLDDSVDWKVYQNGNDLTV